MRPAPRHRPKPPVPHADGTPKTKPQRHVKDTPETALAHPAGTRLAAWLQLLRLPNLPTVPGDPIAGYLLAASAIGAPVTPRLALMALVSLMLYCAGLLANDYFDLTEDRRHRPTRPLPAGLVRPRTAITVAAVLTALGLAAAWPAGTPAAVTALVLAGMVWGYNFGLKRLAVLGPLAMGLCRGLSLLLGTVAVAGWHPPGIAIAAACGLTGYIAAVTTVAAGETSAGRVGPRRWLPPSALIIWGAVLYWLLLAPAPASASAGTAAGLPAASLAVIALGLVMLQTVRLGRQLTPRAKQRAVGSLLAALPVIQAALASVGYATAQSQQALYLTLALALGAAWPAAALLARRFYAS